MVTEAPHQCEHFRPTDMVFTIWAVTCGSGVLTGTDLTSISSPSLSTRQSATHTVRIPALILSNQVCRNESLAAAHTFAVTATVPVIWSGVVVEASQVPAPPMSDFAVSSRHGKGGPRLLDNASAGLYVLRTLLKKRAAYEFRVGAYVDQNLCRECG